jgi:hypothetical protein
MLEYCLCGEGRTCCLRATVRSSVNPTGVQAGGSLTPAEPAPPTVEALPLGGGSGATRAEVRGKLE